MRQPSGGSNTPLSETADQLRNDWMGIPAAQAQPLLQQDSFKELVNKLAWVLGSTYRVPYSNVRTPARQMAITLARVTIADHGYPSQIGFPKK